jgi:hypothetical protein
VSTKKKVPIASTANFTRARGSLSVPLLSSATTATRTDVRGVNMLMAPTIASTEPGVVGASAHQHFPAAPLSTWQPAAIGLIAGLSGAAKDVPHKLFKAIAHQFPRATRGGERQLAVLVVHCDRNPGEKITDRTSAQIHLRHEPQGWTGRNQVGQIVLVVGGDQDQRWRCRQPGPV